MKRSRKVAALIILGGFLSFLICLLSGVMPSGASSKAIGVLGLSSGALMALWWTLKVFSASVTISKDSIELRDLFGKRKITLSAIRGRREYTVRGKSITDYLKIEPTDGRIPALEFERNFNFDSAFFEWFYSLPDLDEVEEMNRGLDQT
jgi:hypothetical protein